MGEEINVGLDRATSAFNAANFQGALEAARNVLAVEPTNADAKLIEAVSLSQLGIRTEASAAFDEAIRLAPTNSKTRFNAAVHEFNVGNMTLARKLVDESLELDPKNEGAKALLDKFPKNENVDSPYPRVASGEFESPHEGIPFIKNLGQTWVAIGWGITAVSLLVFVFALITQLKYFPEILSASTSGDQGKIAAIQAKAANPVLTVLSYLLIPVNVVFVLLDLIHRRGNMLWLIGHIPCSCCGMGWITTPLYLLLGRK